jgi:phenylpyruvate tautomerase PptA (4-oxalocrotonate tautomerase family)
MPVIEVHLIEGYAGADKARLCAVLTDAARLVVPAPADAVTVMIHDHAPEGYMRGRTAKTPAPALPDAAEVVRGFLSAMEARDLDAAQAMLGDGFEMRFPGAPVMTRLAELVDWARPRYRFVRKSYDRFDTAPTAQGAAVVYCFGTLAGEWPDGTAFDGIRFIDRFELEGGRIVRQDVWNDIAEVRP